MRIFGLEIRRTEKALQTVDSRGGWFPLVREPYAGAWQKNDELKPETLLAYHAVFSCITLIAADIGKLRPKLVRQTEAGIWEETTSAAFSPVLKRPNRYQNHIQFKEWWITSKLSSGNAYALKERDNRGVVIAEHLLDPRRVTPLVSEDGAVYYQLKTDNLAGITEDLTVPASEIIHDRMNCLFHPLVGISPLYAAGLSASQGLSIQRNSAKFFSNNSQPGGILTAPGAISDATAKRLKEHWEQNYTGENAGKTAVVGDGLKYEPIMMTANDAQLVDQLKMTAEVVCSVFHVPGFLVQVGQLPTYNNVEALNQQYYSQCLQTLIESYELCHDEGLALPAPYGVELDLDGLLRMDTSTLYKSNNDAVGGGWMKPNEARRRANLAPVDGGDTPYLQVQNYSLAALDRRDRNNPLTTPAAPAPAEPVDDADVTEMALAHLYLKSPESLIHA